MNRRYLRILVVLVVVAAIALLVFGGGRFVWQQLRALHGSGH